MENRIFYLALLIGIISISCWNEALAEEQSVEPLLDTHWHVYQWPYNAYFPDSEDGINGHLGNACGPTAMAQIIKYWDYPLTGNGNLSFTDNAGYYWNADFGATNYEWGDMPLALNGSMSEDEYQATATLMYHCAVAMHDFYGTGQSLEILKNQMVEYFRFDESAQVLYREDYSHSEWDAIFRNELDENRPIMIEGWGPGSAAPGEPGIHYGHYFICDGYNEQGNFHIQWNFGNSDGYYPLYEFRDGQNIDYSTYNWALIGFMPENHNSVDNSIVILPSEHLLVSAYPNPFNAFLKLHIRTQTAEDITISIFNLQGQRVFKQILPAATGQNQTVLWNANHLATGTYMCRFKANNQSVTKRVFLVK